MSDDNFMHRLSAVLVNQPFGSDTWSDAGRMVETAHRTKLPVGWTAWTALILLPVVTLCLLAL